MYIIEEPSLYLIFSSFPLSVACRKRPPPPLAFRYNAPRGTSKPLPSHRTSPSILFKLAPHTPFSSLPGPHHRSLISEHTLIFSLFLLFLLYIYKIHSPY